MLHKVEEKKRQYDYVYQYQSVMNLAVCQAPTGQSCPYPEPYPAYAQGVEASDHLELIAQVAETQPYLTFTL